MRKPKEKSNQFKTETHANDKELVLPKGYSLDKNVKRETLNGNEKRFRELVELLPEPVFEVNLSGQITYTNMSALKLTGYTAEDIQSGTNVYRFFVPDQRALVEANIKKMFQGENIGANEYRMLRKDGTTFWALVHARPAIIKDKPTGFTGILVDISDRKRTEEELRLKRDQLTKLVDESSDTLKKTTQRLGEEVTERQNIEKRLAKSETLYQTLVETAKDVIWTLDLNFKYTFVSPSVFGRLGYTVEEMMSKDPLEIMTPESRELTRRLFQQEVSTETQSPRDGTFSRTQEVEIYRKDGSKIWIEYTTTFLRNEDGSPFGVLGISRDITDRKMAQQELEQARNDLEQKVRDRTAELRSANEKLKQEIADRVLSEKALSESETRFRTLFETAQDCIFIKDRELRYTHINPAMLQKLGTVQSQVLGKTDEDLFGQAYFKQSRKLESRVLQGESVETEQHVSFGTQQFILSIVRSPMRDSSRQVSGVYGMARDLTDRKLRETEPTPFLPSRYISRAMREAMAQTELAAKTESVILFQGESGSGKDYLTRYLHESSNRASGPFLGINCAALPEELVESELFGHEPGSFTGSVRRKRGLVELAEGGTLLLNEVGELPLRLQAKLLTFMDNKSFMRVGGEREIRVNSRVVAASNRDLKREVQAGNFRADLYYRLNVFCINVPPVRERLEDLPVLVAELLDSLSKRMGRSQSPRVDKAVMEVLKGYQWPGNVRELRNVLERALILCGKSDQIAVGHLGVAYQVGFDVTQSHNRLRSVEIADLRSFPEALSETKRSLIEEALQRSGGSIKQTALILGITRDSLVHYMKSLGISR